MSEAEPRICATPPPQQAHAHRAGNIPARSKPTEVGMIPEDWEVARLGKIAPLAYGKGLPVGQRNQSGDIPVFGSNGVVGYHDSPLTNGPTIVIGRKGTAGAVHYSPIGCWPIDTTFYSSNRDPSLTKFRYYALNVLHLDRMDSESAVPGLNRSSVHSCLVAFPPLPEQRIIAEVLSDVDDLLESLDALIAKKRVIKQATMQQLLTGKTRLPGFSGEWETKRLGSTLTVRHGRSQQHLADPEGKYPILASGGEIGRTGHFLYDKPSVLIGRKGTIDEPQYVYSPFWTIDTLFYTEIAEGMSVKFLYYKFCMIPWRRYNEASGVPSLNSRTIENIEVNVPELDEQRAISAVVSDMDAEIAALEVRRNKNRAIKQGMMQQLLTGQVRLT